MKSKIKALVSLFVIMAMALSCVPAVSLAADNTTYLLRNVNAGAQTEVSMSVYQTYETEHFQIFYDTDGANSNKVTADFLKKCETVLENCWNLYIGKMGMEPTSTSVNPDGDKVTQYKTNVILMGTGVTYYDLGADDWGAYGSVDTAGYPYFMCCLAAMDSPTVVAHEFGHAVHYAQGDNAWKDNIYLGPWFEAVANWFAEQYIYEYMPGTSQLSHLYLRANSLTKMNGRGYYEAWPILQYLTEDPDNTGIYGEKFVQKLLGCNLGSTDVLFWEVLESCNGDLTVADTVGMYASHIATMDFKNQDLYNKNINDAYNNRTFFWQQRYTMLEKLGAEENTYAVPIERAPQAMGYNIIPLECVPGEVSVRLNGLTDADGADWRARLVKKSNGETSYSDLFSDGEAMTMTVGESDSLYLSVAATPSLDTMSRHTITGWAEHSTESNYPFENKTQYPYSVTLTNASPVERPVYPTLKQHPNGGGRVADTASVAPTAYVGPNAMVLGYATVSDNAVIDGYAIVAGNAVVKDNAYVGDTAVLFDRATVSDNARVIENACLYVDYKASGNAVVKGQSLGLYNGGVTGEAITYGDWFEDEGYSVGGGAFSGYHSISSDSSYAPNKLDGNNVRPYISGLRTRYEFNSDLRDTVGYTDLYGVNGVKFADGCAVFDGNSYAVLDDSALYYDDMKIALRAKGSGEVLNIGDGQIVLDLTPTATKLTIGDTVVEGSGVSNDAWSDISITFEDSEAELTVNGKSERAAVELTPLMAVRTGSNYIGKGFVGQVDYVRLMDSTVETESIGELDDSLHLVLDGTDSGESGTLNSKTNDADSIWHNWKSGNSAVNVNGGLNITGAVTGEITSPGYSAEKFVIEFEPSGGDAYPDHGILDLDGRVLFAHRYASDANAIHVGRGETNSAVRGSGYVTDTAGQQRLSSFVAEKLYPGSIRADRGTVGYSEGNRIRIIAENTEWSNELAEKFTDCENSTGNLSGMSVGDDVYLVTYALLDADLISPVSQSVYKGSITGFGGFKTAGGKDGVTVSYKDIRIYTDKGAPKVEAVGGKVLINGLEGSAEAIFAIYDNSALSNVCTVNVTGNSIDIPEGFEESTMFLFTLLNELIPLAKPLKILVNNALTSAVGQNADAFHQIDAAADKAVYSFSFVDNGSKDSGIIIGSDGAGLNSSSPNYFASGSIVILFADGKLYTRDNAEKALRDTYTVGEKVKIRVEADVTANVYDLYVNDALKAENVAFRQAADVLDTLALVENNGGKAFELYDFAVE